MLDFDVKWRPWRALYVIAITSAIYWLTGHMGSLLALLAYIDVDFSGMRTTGVSPDEDG